VKGGVTKRIEDITKALDQNQLKRALYLSEAKGMERHHEWIKEAARTCLASREDKGACAQAIQRAREKVQGTVSLPLDDTSLEGLEEYMTEQQLPEESIRVKLAPELPEETKPVETPAPVEAPAVPSGFLSKAQKTDEELFEECEECHVAVAASRFADVCAANHEEAGGCELIGRSLENENTEPVDWIKAMVQTAEKAEGKSKQEMVGAITELTEYLERRNSPLLKSLDKEVKQNG